MSRAAHARAAEGTHGLPTPAELAALGAVLCVHPADAAIMSSGVAPSAPSIVPRIEAATCAELQASVDTAGAREAIAFLDADGRCRGRLFLLPDTDFLAWDALAARLPQRAALPVAQGAVGFCQRIQARWCSGRWRAVALRLRAVAHEGRWTLLAASTPLSVLGLEVAHAIARAEDAEPMLAPPLQAWPLSMS